MSRPVDTAAPHDSAGPLRALEIAAASELRSVASCVEADQSRAIRRRLKVAVTLLCLGWFAAAGRLVQLQVLQRTSLGEQSARQSYFEEEIIPRPGDIVDREGRLLATTIRTQSLYLVPAEIARPWEVVQAVAACLELDADELFIRLGDPQRKHFLWVRRRLTPEQVEQVRQLNLPAGSWGLRDEYRRIYPQGTLAAHVLGLRDLDGIGHGGVEEFFDRRLRGTSGRRVLRRDARGKIVDVQVSEEQPPEPGRHVRLSLDSVVQLQTERALDELMETWKPGSACAAVMDVATGEMLAMATRPAFDPNQPELATADAWTNRIISDVYEPGSTFKPFVVAYGLDRQLIARDEAFNCESGAYRMGRRILHDHHPYGRLSLTDVLVKSSNIGMAKVGERLENPGLHAAATLFGFGRRTGIELPAEQPGTLHPLEAWTTYSTGSIPMGHELAATPLQLLSAHAALAAHGVAHQPTILARDAQSSLMELQAEQRLVEPATADWLIQQPLTQVVERGTGRRARLSGYSVFGKTGTAQVLSPEGAYSHGRYVSSFLCGAPSESPRVVVIVVVNQAEVGSEAFGGKVAAPAAAKILEHALTYLRVPAKVGPQAKRAIARTRQ